MIPESVTAIGVDAFDGCSNLNDVYIFDLEKWCNFKFTDTYNNPLYYAENLYLDGELVEDLVIPDSVTSIGYAQFYGLDSLKSVIMHENVETVEDYAFRSCNNMRYAVIPKDILYIKNDAFANCSALSKVFFTGDEATWNDALIYEDSSYLRNADVTFDATVKTYNFVTNCDNGLEPITEYCISVSPTVENGDKKIYGWYDNPELKGDNVAFPYSGDATTLYAAWTGKTGTDFDDAIVVKGNCRYSSEAVEDNYIYYEYTAQGSGENTFIIDGITSGYFYIYDSQKREIAYDNANDGKLELKYNCKSGEKYYIRVRSNANSSFSLLIQNDAFSGTKTVCITSVTGEKIFTCIPNNLPENADVILACYNDNSLVEIQSVSNKNETICFVVDKEFEYAKVMVWESFSSMIPVSDVENVN